MKKVILVSIDGMRPDGFLGCGNPFARELMARGSYALDAQTVTPSVTLPCHMSMFHSVTPQRHGITTNTYIPMVRPLNGLFEQINLCGGISAFFYGWDPLRDIARPRAVKYAAFQQNYTTDGVDGILTDLAIHRIRESKPDFVFVYMGETDEKGGPDCGWMTETYLGYISKALDNVKRLMEAAGDEYTVVITADHGGHDRTHGTEMPEDMTIPMVFVGPGFVPGKQLPQVSMLDIAPTIAKVMGVLPAREWEGKALL